MYEFKHIEDEDFFNCKLRGVNNVVNAVFGSPTDDGGHYANIPPSVLEKAAARGKAVHEAIEHYLKRETETIELGLEYCTYEHFFNEWQNNRCEIQERIGVEVKLISEELACKGIIDFIGKFQNKGDDGYEGEPYYALVDWKTSSSLDEFRTQCQLTLYYFLLKEQYPKLAKLITQLRCLQITKYEYRWFRFPIDEKLGESILYLYKQYRRCDHE